MCAYESAPPRFMRARLRPGRAAVVAAWLYTSGCGPSTAERTEHASVPAPVAIEPAAPPAPSSPTAEAASSFAIVTSLGPFTEGDEVPVSEIDTALHEIDNALLVTRSRPRVDHDPDATDPKARARVGIVTGGGEPSFPEGLLLSGPPHSTLYDLVGASGRWPDAVTLLGNTDQVILMLSDRWLLTSSEIRLVNREHGSVRGLFADSARIGGRVVTLAVGGPFTREGPGRRYVASRLGALRGSPPSVDPEALDTAGCGPDHEPPGQDWLPFSGMTLTGADGRIAIAGVHCHEGPTLLLLDPPDVKRLPLPATITDADPDMTFVEGVDGTRWLLGGGAARLEGGRWVEAVAAPDGVSLTDGAITFEGVLWAIGDGRVFRLESDGFVEVPLPEDVEEDVADIALTPEGRLWLATPRHLLRLE